MYCFEDKLREYARLLVEVGVNLQPGQTLVLSAAVDQAAFARLCADAAYELGCKEVVMNWSDDYLLRSKYLKAQEDVFDSYPEWSVRFLTDYAKAGAAFLRISSSNPQNLKGVNPDRLLRAAKASAKVLGEYRELQMASVFPWSIGALASPAWAKLVFPALNEQEAVETLWEKIFLAVRIKGDGSAVEAWKAHDRRMQDRARVLNEYNFDRLHYYNALGTDFTVGLPKGHIWCGGGEFTPGKQYFMPNMPTEEIFTAPDRNRSEGVLCASMPLCHSGNLIENIRFELKEGRIVKATATENEELLNSAISVDEGAAYLGEVALVPYDSPIRNTQVLFYNTLFDENAACHFAFGEAYPSTVEGALDWDRETKLANGVNVSNTHVDFMVGTKDLSIDGYTQDGVAVPVFRDGNFCF